MNLTSHYKACRRVTVDRRRSQRYSQNNTTLPRADRDLALAHPMKYEEAKADAVAVHGDMGGA